MTMLLSADYVLGTVPRTLLFHFVPTTAPRGTGHHYFHFAGEKTEAQGDEASWPRSQSYSLCAGKGIQTIVVSCCECASGTIPW